MNVFTRRRAGLLLHLSSLPSPYGIGNLGAGAHHFLDFLQAAGQSLWQMLPIHPTGYGHSPYSALSSFAGNPLFIDPDELVRQGDLRSQEAIPWNRTALETDYEHALCCLNALLPGGAHTFFTGGSDQRRSRYETFCAENSWWLNDYALFQALRETFGGKPWTAWPPQLRDRDDSALKEWGTRLGRRIDEVKYQQFVFFEQWHRLKTEANRRDILLFGDVPFYVAHDSADVWCNRHLFRLDAEGRPTAVAGVPPDCFSETGQLWGNPLYDWPRHRQQDFSWWRARIRWALSLFDVVRLDHFRGLAACWAVPASAPDARSGRWETSPGHELLQALKQDLGGLPLVAEDLGIITDDVTDLRCSWGLPGMRILQFAFDSGPDNPYLPHNHTTDSVVYTGTHDNDTCAGWWKALAPARGKKVLDYLQVPGDRVCQEMVRQALASVGIFSVLPVQDLLQLDSSARMNRPGRADGNWTWRLAADMLTDTLARDLLKKTVTYGRATSDGVLSGHRGT